MTTDLPGGQGLRLQHGDWPDVADRETPAAAGPLPDLPDWARNRPPARARPPQPVSPSDLGGPKALGGEAAELDAETAMRRGRMLHRLLEHLPLFPAADWDTVAHALLTAGDDLATAAETAESLAETRAVLDADHLGHLFDATALAEVDISGLLPSLGDHRMIGTIDRLIIRDDSVLAVDFKSNAVIPTTPAEVPEGILRQMGAYAEALGQIYPDRRVETAILWTKGGVLMQLPHEIVSMALARATIS